MIQRPARVREVATLLRASPVVALLGARQVGKTTLARQVRDQSGGPSHWFDLERDPDLARLENPLLALEPLRGLVVIDEVQRRPDLFKSLRVLADRPGARARFLILGSASPSLLRQGSETLAGRIAFCTLGGLSLDEIGPSKFRDLWLRGGFPKSLLARADEDSLRWRLDFTRTFLERDIPGLGIRVASSTLARFWRMLAHAHGQTLNTSELARSFGVSDMAVRHYLEILCSTYVVKLLAPWHENLAKRQVRAPKVYLADSGLLHALLGIDLWEDLEGHPKLGASWEGFAIEAAVRALGARPDQCYFWATHAGAELDLVVVQGRRRIGVELKYTDSPRITASMRIALSDLKLDRLCVVHAGEQSFPMEERIRAVALRRILSDLSAKR